MTTSYRGQVAVAFEVLAEGLAPFVDSRMSRAFPDEDWILMAAGKLGKRRDVLVSLSDPHFQLEVINRWWGPAFGDDLDDSVRQTITDLRTARNHWAHPDEDHPFDFEYAVKVHHDAEEVLRVIKAPEADRMEDLTGRLRWDNVRDEAREKGLTEADALMDQVVTLQKQYDELQAQLDDARSTAQSATGRQRAFARQLAELQSQYAAVSGLRDDYVQLQKQLQEERAQREAAGESSQDDDELGRATVAVDSLQAEAESLRQQLSEARTALRDVDPLQTATGQRWIWLVSALLVLMAALIAIMASITL
jgi:hypothetical protein